MTAPLMPKATALWLIENTSLTFEQIGDYCHLHPLEVQALADGDIASGMTPVDPIARGDLTQHEIDRCQGKDAERLEGRISVELENARKKAKGSRYVPVAKRANKPDAIAWIVKHHPEITDAALGRLLGTTSPTIHAIRNKTHRNSPNILAKNPVILGLCTQIQLDKAVEKANKGKEPKED